MFVLFLLVLLGISALAIDYASWLLTDRHLQNVADHAALAGASDFEDRTTQGNCSGGSGQAKCIDARAQAWTSLNDQLALGLTPAAIGVLALTDSPNGGTTSVTVGATTFSWADPIWVATPPPNHGSYTDFGGRYFNNFGVIWVRVDRDVRSFLGGALGIDPEDRTGWATAGSLPTDYALQVFCRDQIAPQGGVCENSAGLTIDGQGGIRLIRGDIGANESLKVTANGGGGVVLENGNMFLVNEVCAPSTWNCPNGPPSLGGISDGVNGKNAFYIAPFTVPRFASPLELATVSAGDCAGASLGVPCVPYQDEDDPNPGSPGDWECDMTGVDHPLCGQPSTYYPAAPTVTDPASLNPGDLGHGSIRCDARLPGTPDNHLDPITGGDPGDAQPTPNQNNANKYRNIDDDYLVPDIDTTATPTPPTDWLAVNNITHPNNGGNPSTQNIDFTINLNQPFGTPTDGLPTTVRYTAFKTDGGAVMGTDSGYPITLTVSLLRSGVSVASDTRVLTIVPTRYEFTVGAGILDAANGDYNSLSLQFNFQSINQVRDNAMHRGGAVSWAEAETPALLPSTALPPMIPPGYYHEIIIPDGGCAILDPTSVHGLPGWELEQYQLPGVYRFGGGSDGQIKLGNGAYLIGDGVTLVFDPDWPDPTGGRGIVLAPDAALILNTAIVEQPAGYTPCTPYEEVNPHDPTNTDPIYNPSAPLPPLPYSALCAAWGFDPTVTSGIRPGMSNWPICEDTTLPQCVDRSLYNPTAPYRGITFYFTPDPGWGTAHASMDIRGRFSLGGASGNDSGIAFRGVLYAPYDDVKISGGNGFNTVGQVLSWTAKFNGGSAYIDLDYPYEFNPSAPYLLEPTVNR